jgi:hypothetical protein
MTGARMTGARMTGEGSQVNRRSIAGQSQMKNCQLRGRI